MPVNAFDPMERDWFSKPSDALLSQMRRRGVTVAALSAALDGGFEAVRGLLEGEKPIDGPTAVALQNTVGGTAAFWLKRQANFERDLENTLLRIPEAEISDWLTKVPSPGEKPRGRLNTARQRDEIRRRLIYFNVASLGVWTRRYGLIRGETQFRTSPTYFSDDRAVSLWLRRGEIEASLVTTKPWSLQILQNNLDKIRELSRIRKPTIFIPRLRELCAEAGVALVIAQAPQGCRASGACRFIAEDKAMLLLSFRFRSDDQFWFSLFREIGHLILHGGRTFVDDEKTGADQLEQQADNFAAEQIIPLSKQAEFSKLRSSMDAIVRFSVSIRVAPGLVVGQMQHRQMIGRESMNFLKRRWTNEEISRLDNA